MGSLTETRQAAGTPLEITSDVIGKYAAITNDYNPIHVDPKFAAKTPMKGVIAHGTMSLALIWQMLRRNFGPVRCAGAALDIRFTKPVRIGDQLIAKHSPQEDGAFAVWVENQTAEAVIKGTVRL